MTDIKDAGTRTRNAPDRLSKIKEIIDEIFPEPTVRYRLKNIANVMVENGDGDEDALWVTLYHTYQHIFAVVIRADEIAKKSNFTIYERKILFIAALFHDYYHGYGKGSDVVNVCKSIHAMIDLLGASIDSQILNDAADAIFCTVFPFRVRPENEIECILRDADLTMSLEPDAEWFAEGLQNEFKIAGKYIKVTVNDMIVFAKSQRFYTLHVANLFGIPYAYNKTKR